MTYGLEFERDGYVQRQHHREARERATSVVLDACQ